MKVSISGKNGRKRVAPLAASLVAAFLLAGCSTIAGIEAAGKMATSPEGAPPLTKVVAIHNPSLGRRVEIVDLRAATAGDLMTAQVSLRSKDRDTLPLQYKFVWFDAFGMELAAHTGWTPLIVYAEETMTLQAVAPDTRAREFRLTLREPDLE